MTFAARMARVAPSPTLKVAAEADRLRRAGVDVVDFGAGEPDFPTPANVLDAAHRVYFNASSGLYFDPRSSLYWSASSASSSQPVIYYVWDAAAAQFVVAPADGQLSS